jgi:CrcB protein
MERLLLVCLAGALGSGARYLLGVWVTQRFEPAFPYATLTVNLVGCFLMGLLMQVAASVAGFPDTLRIALATGFLGGLTTYSAFNYETTALLREGTMVEAFVNLGLTMVGCFAAGLLGFALARWSIGGE